MGCNGMYLTFRKHRIAILTFGSYDLLCPDYLWTAWP